MTITDILLMDMLSNMNDTHEEKVAVSKILIWYIKKILHNK